MHLKTLILLISMLGSMQSQRSKLDETTFLRFVSIMKDSKELNEYFPTNRMFFLFDSELMVEELKGDHYFTSGTISIWTREELFESYEGDHIVLDKFRIGKKSLSIEYYVDGGPDRGKLFKDKIRISKL